MGSPFLRWRTGGYVEAALLTAVLLLSGKHMERELNKRMGDVFDLGFVKAGSMELRCGGCGVAKGKD